MGQNSWVTDSPTSKGAPETARTPDDAKPFCDYVSTEFATADAAAKTAVTQGSATTANAFSGHSKCTYQFYVAEGKGAPTLKFSKADYRNFIVHWMEWSGVTGDMPAGMLFPTAAAGDVSLVKMGQYGGTPADDLMGQIATTKFFNPFTTISNSAVWPA